MDAELRDIAVNMGYVEEARLAAIAELKKREIHEFDEAEESIHKELERKEERINASRRVWEEMPKEMKWVIRAVWASTIISAISIFLGFFSVSSYFQPAIGASGVMILIFLLILFGITALFVVGFERKMNWVRWLFVGLVGYSTLTTFVKAMGDPFHYILVLSY